VMLTKLGAQSIDFVSLETPWDRVRCRRDRLRVFSSTQTSSKRKIILYGEAWPAHRFARTTGSGWRSTDQHHLTVRIFDPDGPLVCTLLDEVEPTVGARTLVWDGTDGGKQALLYGAT